MCPVSACPNCPHFLQVLKTTFLLLNLALEAGRPLAGEGADGARGATGVWGAWYVGVGTANKVKVTGA
jgi:hypothetical protein